MKFLPSGPIAFEKTQKIKTRDGITARYNHNYRVGDIPANASRENSYLNEELISLEGKDYGEVLDAKLATLEKRPRKDSVLALEVVLKAQNTEGDFDLEAWKKASAEWVQRYFGKDNVISAVYHGDEQVPHIHAMVIPIVDGSLKCYKFTNGKDKLSEMQTDYAKAVEHLGLERGMERTPVAYDDLKTFTAATGKVVKQELPPPEMGESLNDYFTRANEVYQTANITSYRKRNELEIAAQKEIERVKREARTEVSTAKEKVEEIENKFEELQKSIRPLVDENADLKKQVSDLETRIKLQRKEFDHYMQNGLTISELMRVKSLNKVFSAFDQRLLGEETLSKKETVLDIMNEAIRAYDAAERAKGEIMDDRELSETQDFEFDDAE